MTNLVAWLEQRREYCFELLRMYLGAGLVSKGVLFASDPQVVANYVKDGYFDAVGTMIAHYVVLVHFTGGLLLFLGLLTRLAALLNVPVLLGAVVFVHQREGLFSRSQGLEFALFVLFALVLIAWHGSGKWSLDRVLFPAPPQPARFAKERIA
ncbi:MAG TPA: DoxX family protein [Planctomycetota bacterium]